MVLFSYNPIYRDQTLSARITRGMYEGLSISKITLDRKEINWVVNQS